MSKFFKKLKSPTSRNPPRPFPGSNGTAVRSEPKQRNMASSSSVPCLLPPMQNFIPPPDVVADALSKTNRRSTSTVSDVLGWARDYFSAFLNNEGVGDILEIWEKLQNARRKTKIALKTEGVEITKEKVDEILRTIGASNANNNGNTNNNNNNEDQEEGDTTGTYNEQHSDNTEDWIEGSFRKINKILQERYLIKYLETKYHVKCQMDLFTNGGNVSLYDVLLNQSALFYFMEYAEQEGKREVLEFWLGATNFSEQFNNNLMETESSAIAFDVKTAVGDAMVLYEKYISLQAPHPLGLSDEIRSEVETKICSPDEITSCFTSAIVDAFAFLHVTCLEGFLKSSLFLTFLSDLIGSMNSANTSRVAPDCSSVGSSGSVKSFPVSTSSSLTSPTPSREREKGKLTLGRVNALGKFEPDVDLELFKKESGITKTVKKLVNFDDKEKAKEELAWQVAAMIVNEVCSITMGPGPPSAGESS